jgi:hypothetical protein
MSKFKVGDTFVGKYGAIEITGTRIVYLMKYEKDTLMIDYKYIDLDVGESFNGSCSSYSFEEKFKPRYKYTRLAEKLYPNGKRDGKWWVLQ